MEKRKRKEKKFPLNFLFFVWSSLIVANFVFFLTHFLTFVFPEFKGTEVCSFFCFVLGVFLIFFFF
jgi:hypothetical protein